MKFRIAELAKEGEHHRGRVRRTEGQGRFLRRSKEE